MKTDLIQMIDTLEHAQQTHYAEGVQEVIRGLRQMLGQIEQSCTDNRKTVNNSGAGEMTATCQARSRCTK